MRQVRFPAAQSRDMSLIEFAAETAARPGTMQ
jgi:hypothetical protein